MFSREAGVVGSATLFKEESFFQHKKWSEQFTAEVPSIDVDPRTGFQVVLWNQISNDNEALDNFVGCMAALAMQRVDFTFREEKTNKVYNINDFFEQQKRRK